MKLVDAHARLLGMRQSVFRTSDAAACLQLGNAHASKLLDRLAEAGHLHHLARSLWGVVDKVEALALPAHLTAPLPSYISLQTALYYHGMISQMPSVIYAVSIARTRRFETPLGVVSIHHMEPAFFGGFDVTEKGRIPLATPEKALLDIFYYAPARSKLFRSLPEIELPENFREQDARKMIRNIRSSRRRAMVESLLDKMLAAQKEMA